MFFDPKTEWRYGVSTDVLGRIIEVVTKQTLYDFLNDNIFKPLEMFDTHFQIPKHKLNRFVSNYRFDKPTNNLEKVDDWQKTRYRSVTLESGGGGLISGAINVFKQLSPQTKIIGIEPKGAPSMFQSLKKNRLVKLDKIDRFVDGIAVKKVGNYSFDFCKKYLDDIIILDENEICNSILELKDQKEKTSDLDY